MGNRGHISGTDASRRTSRDVGIGATQHAVRHVNWSPGMGQEVGMKGHLEKGTETLYGGRHNGPLLMWQSGATGEAMCRSDVLGSNCALAYCICGHGTVARPCHLLREGLRADLPSAQVTCQSRVSLRHCCYVKWSPALAGRCTRTSTPRTIGLSLGHPPVQESLPSEAIFIFSLST